MIEDDERSLDPDQALVDMRRDFDNLKAVAANIGTILSALEEVVNRRAEAESGMVTDGN